MAGREDSYTVFMSGNQEGIWAKVIDLRTRNNDF